MEVSAILLLIQATLIVARYNFDEDWERQLCEVTNLINISAYREVSIIPLSWNSSVSCCHKKGRIIHTIERSDDSELYPLTRVLPREGFWAGIHAHEQSHYQWTFHTDLRYVDKRLSRDKYVWADGEPTPDDFKNRRCGMLTPTGDVIQLRPKDCRERYKFICQRVEQRGGDPIRGYDMMLSGSIQFESITGYTTLKFSPVAVQWATANAMCQKQNMALIDHVHDKYGEGLIRAIQKDRQRIMRDSDRSITTFLTSGNDFCHPWRWEWLCGEHTLTIPFHKNCTNEKRSLDKLYHHRDRCIHYLIPSENNTEGIALLTAMNKNCNDRGYVICDTAPECPFERQYNCLQREPHYVNIDEGFEEDLRRCQNKSETKWYQKKIKTGINHHVSAERFTWKAALACCAWRRMELPVPVTAKELYDLQGDTLHFVKEHCGNTTAKRRECDGYWSGATNIGAHIQSPLRFPDGKTLPRSLYSWIRADLFSYPSCGRINRIDRDHVKYNYANCLEKNFIVCVKKTNATTNSSSHEEGEMSEIRGRSLKSLASKKRNQVIKKEKPLFDRSKLTRFDAKPNRDDLDYRVWDRYRDTCTALDTLKKYKEACPRSSTSLSPNVRPKPLSKGDELINAQIVVETQNRFLLQQLIHFGMKKVTNSLGSNEPHPRPFLLLGQSITLYSIICPLVPHRFLQKVYDSFLELWRDLNKKRRPDIINREDLKWTMELIGKCMRKVKPAKLLNDKCKDFVTSRNCNCSDYICTEAKYESKLYKSDLLLDVIWKLFEATYSVCFPVFVETNMLLHHKYAMVMIDLYEHEQLRIRWQNQMADMRFWRNLLGPRFNLHVINMERCNKANIENGYFPVRLDPSMIPVSGRIEAVPYGKIEL